MKPLTISSTPLSLDALRSLELFGRYGRRRAGRGLRRSALEVLAGDPGFDLWFGIGELVLRGLIAEDVDRSSFVLTAAGARTLRPLPAPPSQAARDEPRPRPGARGMAA